MQLFRLPGDASVNHPYEQKKGLSTVVFRFYNIIHCRGKRKVEQQKLKHIEPNLLSIRTKNGIENMLGCLNMSENKSHIFAELVSKSVESLALV